MRSTENKSESQTGTEDGGNVGIENNIPAALGGDGPGTTSSRSESDELVQYEIGNTRREIIREAGDVRRMTVAIAVLVGVGITLTTANVFQTLGFSLLAGAGGLTLMLGFAAREVLANILASLQISVNRSARVGDQLIIEDKLCTVERIHFSFVQLKVWDGTRLVVPVSEFVSESFVNRTLVDSQMTRAVVLTVAPHVDVDSLRDRYTAWMDSDDRVGDSDTYECLVIGQNEHGLQVRFCAVVPDPRDGWDVECELREDLTDWLKKRDPNALPCLGASRPEEEDSVEDEAAEAA